MLDLMLCQGSVVLLLFQHCAIENAMQADEVKAQCIDATNRTLIQQAVLQVREDCNACGLSWNNRTCGVLLQQVG
jgi:hypothetical protein